MQNLNTVLTQVIYTKVNIPGVFVCIIKRMMLNKKTCIVLHGLNRSFLHQESIERQLSP